MADNPLVKFWNDTLTQANADKSNADTGLKTAQDDLKAKRDALAAAVSKTKAAQQTIAGIRAKLAAIPTGDDGTALLAQFRQATLDLRAALGKQLGAEDDVANAVATLSNSSSVAAAAGGRIAAASGALADSKQSAAARDALKDAVTRPPVTTLGADAKAATTSPPFTTAQARIQNDFPASLVAAAEARFQQETARLTRGQAASDLTDSLAAGSSQPGMAGIALSQALAVLQGTVRNGAKQLAQAVSALARVADPGQATLTKEESAAIQGLKADGTPDAALIKSRNDAAGFAAAVANAQQTLDDVTADIANARVQAKANGVDPTKIDDDKNVKAALALLDPAQKAVDAATAKYDSGEQTIMSAWAATVPDANWQLLADYETAKGTLTALSTTDPNAQSTAVTNAETTLAGALQDAGAGPLLLDDVRSEGAKRASLRDAAAGAFARRALSAMRSDF